MRSLLPLCLLLGMLLAPARAAADPDAGTEIRAILATLAAPGGSSTAAEQQLARLGPAAVPALLDAWEREAGRQDADRAATPAVETLRRAIARQSAESLERALRGRLQADPGTSARIAALTTLAAFGGRSGLPLAIEIVAGVAPQALASRALVESWSAALGSALEDRAPAARLLAEWRRVPAPLHVPTARVLAARGTQSDLAAVLAILQRADETLPELLEVVGGASPVVRTGLALMGSLLELRSHGNRNVRAAVARLLGRLGRGDAFTPLLDLLEDEDGGVRRAADAALRRLTGAAAASSSAAWKHWYDDEKTWLEQSRVSTLLRSEQPLEAARALREIGQHPFLGAKHLSLVQRLVDHAAPGVRLLALTTLVRMNRAEVVPDLIRHLNDGDAQVRAAVWKSLQRLSGEDLPGEYRAWSDASQRWRS